MDEHHQGLRQSRSGARPRVFSGGNLSPGKRARIVPISVAILFGLFFVQRKETAFIGNIFGPVMLM